MSKSQNTDPLLKSRRFKRNRTHPKYAYTVVKTGTARSGLGDLIILDGQKEYVCGGCLLLLKHLDVRFFVPSRSLATRVTQRSRTSHFAASKCGCELNFLWLNQSSFLSYPHDIESIFMGFSLTCHCITEISAKVDGLFRKAPSDKPENWRSFGDTVLWMSSRLTDLPDWHITSLNTFTREEIK